MQLPAHDPAPVAENELLRAKNMRLLDLHERPERGADSDDRFDGHLEERCRCASFSAAELGAATPPESRWVWDGYLAGGAITLLAGKPKSGKSTLACAIAEAIVAEEQTSLGRLIEGGPVVYLARCEASLTKNSDAVFSVPVPAEWLEPGGGQRGGTRRRVKHVLGGPAASRRRMRGGGPRSGS